MGWLSGRKPLPELSASGSRRSARNWLANCKRKKPGGNTEYREYRGSALRIPSIRGNRARQAAFHSESSSRRSSWCLPLGERRGLAPGPTLHSELVQVLAGPSGVGKSTLVAALLQAREAQGKERVWLARQTHGELDESRLVDGAAPGRKCPTRTLCVLPGLSACSR